MVPTLKNGDEVFVDLSAYKGAFPQVGDVVLVRHPLKAQLKILKRITAVSANGDLFLQGDNPQESTDSRHYGAVQLDHVYGRVTSLFS